MKKLLLVSVFALFALININSVQAVAGVSSITSDLRYGMTNNVQVRALQQILINEGFMTGVPTGNFFNMTIQAVKKFQAAHSVEATGFVGVTTRTALRLPSDSGSSGDVNGDGKIDCADVKLITESTVSLITLTADQKSRADVNGDGVVNIIDAQQIARNNGLSCSTTTSSAPTVSLSYNNSTNPVSVTSGGSVNFSWSATNINKCQMFKNDTLYNDGVYNTYGVNTPSYSGTFYVGNITNNAMYVLTCSGAGGTQSSKMTVNVAGQTPLPPTDISTAFAAGDNIKTTAIIKVRSSAGITSYDNAVGQQPLGAKGKIQNVDLNGSKSGDNYWWNVNFDSGVDGWVAEAYITKDTAAPDTTVATVSVTPTTNSVTIGATKQLTALAEDASGNTISRRVFTWTSSAPAVATINNAFGVVTGVTAGTATITASSGGKSGTATMTVTTAQTNSCPASYTGPQVTNCASSDFTSSMTATCTAGTWATSTPCRVPEANIRPTGAGITEIDNTNKDYKKAGFNWEVAFSSRYANSCLLNGDTMFNRVTGMTGPLFDWTYANQPVNKNGGILQNVGANWSYNKPLEYVCTGPGGIGKSSVTFTDPYDEKEVVCTINSFVGHKAECSPNNATCRWEFEFDISPATCNPIIYGIDPQSPSLSSGYYYYQDGKGKANTVWPTTGGNITATVKAKYPSPNSREVTKSFVINTSTGITPTSRTAVPVGTTSTTGSEKLLFQALGRDALYKIVHSSATNSLLLKKIQSGNETWSQSYVSNVGNLVKMCSKMVDDNDPHRFANPPNLSIIPYLTNIFAPIFINSCTSVAAGVYGTLEIVGSGSGSSSSSGGSSSGGGSGGGGSSSDSVTGSQFQN